MELTQRRLLRIPYSDQSYAQFLYTLRIATFHQRREELCRACLLVLWWTPVPACTRPTCCLRANCDANLEKAETSPGDQVTRDNFYLGTPSFSFILHLYMTGIKIQEVGCAHKLHNNDNVWCTWYIHVFYCYNFLNIFYLLKLSNSPKFWLSGFSLFYIYLLIWTSIKMIVNSQTRVKVLECVKDESILLDWFVHLRLRFKYHEQKKNKKKFQKTKSGINSRATHEDEWTSWTSDCKTLMPGTAPTDFPTETMPPKLTTVMDVRTVSVESESTSEYSYILGGVLKALAFVITMILTPRDNSWSEDANW